MEENKRNRANKDGSWMSKGLRVEESAAEGEKATADHRGCDAKILFTRNLVSAFHLPLNYCCCCCYC